MSRLFYFISFCISGILLILFEFPGAVSIDGEITCQRVGDTGSFVLAFRGDSSDYAGNIIELADCGFLMTGSTESVEEGYTDAWMVRLGHQGNVIWSRTHDFGPTDQFAEAVELPGGEYLVLGYRDAVPCLFRCDSSGAVLWYRELRSLRARDLLLTGNGNVLVAASRDYGEGHGTPVLMCLTPEGDLVWQEEYPIPNTPGMIENSFGQLAIAGDGGFLLAGTRGEDKQGYCYWSGPNIYRLDDTGQVIWELESLGRFDGAGSLSAHPSGGYFVGSSAFDDAALAMVNDDGDVLWDRYFRLETLSDPDGVLIVSHCRIHGSVILPDGSCVAVGMGTYGDGGIAHRRHMLILVVDPDGNPIRGLLAGDGGDCQASDADVTSDGCLVVCGISRDTETYMSDVLVLRFDDELSLPGGIVDMWELDFTEFDGDPGTYLMRVGSVDGM